MKNDLPKGWEVKKLGEVTSYVDYRGKTPTKSTEGVFLVTAKNVKAGYMDYEISKEYIPYENYEEVMRRGKPQIGDILITTEAPMGNVASIDREGFALAQRIIKLRGKEGIIQNIFLKFYLSSPKFQAELDEKSTGSTAKGIKGSILHKMPLNIPPLPEQHKIAQILSTWDEAIQTTQNLLDKLESRKKGMMERLLSGKGKGWETAILEELGDFTKGMGITKAELVEHGIPCIRYGEIYTVHHFIVSKYYSFISKETAEQSRKISKNDILFAGSGETLEDIGKAVVFIGNEEVYAGGDIIIFSPTNINVDSTYLSYLLNSEFVRKQIRTFEQGQSVVHLYTRDISKIKIPFPPLAKQTAIAKILNTADVEIQETKAYLKTLKQQKKGLMQALLTGKIIVKTDG